MQHNQVFVIQVSNGAANSKSPLALPPAGTHDPNGVILPSEVKYSASLVRGLGLAHLFLGCVIFLLGVLGTWIEPETCWAGAGVWTGLSAVLCGLTGIVAHCFWYKNFSIKAFLVTSVVCVVLSVLAIVLSIYAIVNRHKHFQTLLQEIDEHSWFQPYDLEQEHRLTLNISANLLVGFFLEVGLALWSSRVGWRGVQTPEFSASKREDVADPTSVTPLPPHTHPGQQVPLAALYQLLQAHPEMLGNKSVEAGLVPPWMSGGLGDHPTHHSMDYQERVSRFLSHHAIEDQNPIVNRPISALLSEARDSSAASTSSGGRCSPADTLPLPPPDQAKKETMEKEMQEKYTSMDRRSRKTQSETQHQRDTDSERNVRQTHIDRLVSVHASDKKVKETHVDKLVNRETSRESKVREISDDATSSRNTSIERKVKESHVDTLPKREDSSNRKAKEAITDTPSKRESSKDRRAREPSTETPSKREPSRDRRSREPHSDTSSKREPSRDRRSREPHSDTSSKREPSRDRRTREPSRDRRTREPSKDRRSRDAHTDTPSKREPSRDRKPREINTDTPSKREPSKDRKVKETHVDSLSPRDTSSERKVKQKHSDKRPNGHTIGEKITHVDSLINGDSGSERKVKETHVDSLRNGDTTTEKAKEIPLEPMRSRRNSEHKPRAPTPKIKTSSSFNLSEMSRKSSSNDEPAKKTEVVVEKVTKDKTSEVQSKVSVTVNKEDADKIQEVRSMIIEVTDATTKSKKTDKPEKEKKKKSKKSSESASQETKQKLNSDDVNGVTSDNADATDAAKAEREERKARKERKEKRRKEKEEKQNEAGKSTDTVSLASSIQPPCEFQDT